MKTIGFSAALMLAAATAFAQQPAAPAPQLPLDVAETIAHAAVASCRADGLKVAVLVVDAANVTKVALRDEGASQTHLDFAQAKINSVLLTGFPSGLAPGGAPVMIKGATPQKNAFGGMIGISGGTLIAGIDAAGAVPVMLGSALAGVVSVSGAPSPAKDRACAEAGLAKVADRLK